MRPKGRMSTPERKPVRTEPVYTPREEVKKKKGSHGCIYLACYPFFMLKCHILAGMTVMHLLTVSNVVDVIVMSLSLLRPLMMKL